MPPLFANGANTVADQKLMMGERLMTVDVFSVSVQFHKKGEVLGFLMQLAGALAVAEKVSIAHVHRACQLQVW